MSELNILSNVLETFRKVFHRKYVNRTKYKTFDNNIEDPLSLLCKIGNEIIVPNYINEFSIVENFPEIIISTDMNANYESAYVNREKITSNTAYIYITPNCLRMSRTEYKATLCHELTHINDYLFWKQKISNSDQLNKIMKYYSEIHASEIQAMVLFNTSNQNINKDSIIDIYNHNDITIDKYMAAKLGAINRLIPYDKNYWINKTEDDIGIIVISIVNCSLYFVGMLKVFVRYICPNFTFNFSNLKIGSQIIEKIYKTYELQDIPLHNIMTVCDLCNSLSNEVKAFIADSYSKTHLNLF